MCPEPWKPACKGTKKNPIHFCLTIFFRDYPQSSTPRSASLTRDAQHHAHQYGEVNRSREYSETPGTPRAPQRSVNVHREVSSIEQRSHTARRDGSRDRSAELSPILRRRTPSPGGEFRPATFNSYPHSPAETRRSRSQTRWEDSQVTSSQVGVTFKLNKNKSNFFR